jgi:type VI secretion system secreted protein VgrG
VSKALPALGIAVLQDRNLSAGDDDTLARMSSFDLSFASAEDSLSVRHFSVSEGLSTLFEVAVVAVSPADDIDFETIVGQTASLVIQRDGVGRARGWTGVARRFEQRVAEPTGLSTYALSIVPQLWLATQRQDSRVFQHLTVPAIVREVLAYYRIEPALELDASRYPVQEYRVQYGESDFAFVSRLLEDAGITYRFAWNPEKGTRLVLSDEPQRREPRAGGAIPFVAEPSGTPTTPLVTRVSASREMKPGAFTIRDFDFRRRLDFDLAGKARPEGGAEARLEQYHYRPGAFVTEGTEAHPVPAHADEREGAALAERSLEAERSAAPSVAYHTNLVDLAPGTVFSIGGHPRARIAAPNALLAAELTVTGGEGADVTITGRAVPASAPYRPAKVTPRPRIAGVQSAIVVGPEGEEIHTDEHGRVRVRFHWDRSGARDDRSSCWIRVSQGWAGSGFGMMVIPRVGQEVLVGFFEGDPDQPAVVGRVYNAQNLVPYKLPEHKTRSTWRSASTRGAAGAGAGEPAGYNEILFEDARGAELLGIHAQRDLHKQVTRSEVERTGEDRTITVGRNRSTTVGGVDSTEAGTRHAVTVASTAGGAHAGIELTAGRLVCTTGEATITFDGANLSLEAQGNVTIVAHDGDVVIKGGPLVKINSD